MANVKITALPEATTLNSGDLVCCVADASGSATTSKITVSNLGNAIGIGNTPVDVLKYTQLPSSSSTIDFTDTTGFYAGQGVVLSQSSQTYHLVTQVDTDSKIHLSGPPLDTGTNIVESPDQSFFILAYQRSVPVDIVFSGSYCLQGTTTELIARENRSSFKWSGPPARLVYVAAKTRVTDASSPATYPQINVSLGGTACIASDITLSSTSWISVPNGGIVGASNQVQFGDEVEVQLNSAGGDGDARDLTVSMVFILEQ